MTSLHLHTSTTIEMEIHIEDLDPGMELQAIDENGIWREVVVLNVDEQTININWIGFGKRYDCSVDTSCVRRPVEERLLMRKSINSDNFQKARHPKHLRRVQKFLPLPIENVLKQK